VILLKGETRGSLGKIGRKEGKRKDSFSGRELWGGEEEGHPPCGGEEDVGRSLLLTEGIK